MGVRHGFGLLSPPPMDMKVLTSRQVHGVQVLEAKNVPAKVPADGLWTRAPGEAIGVWTADCLPVLLSSPDGRVVSAIHAGWRGAVRGIVPVAVRTLLTESGFPASLIRAVLGPSAGRCCYQVGGEVWEEVQSLYPGFSGRHSPPGHLDIPGLVLYQLRAAGLRIEHIGTLELCTICHPELFHSHRRQKESREGRSMLNWIQTVS